VTKAASLLPGERYSAPASTGEWRIEDDQGHEVPSAANSRFQKATAARTFATCAPFGDTTTTDGALVHGAVCCADASCPGIDSMQTNARTEVAMPPEVGFLRIARLPFLPSASGIRMRRDAARPD
jgi:hypothetical protein